MQDPVGVNGQLSLPARSASRGRRMPFAGTVLTVVACFGALLAVVVVALDRNASDATTQQAGVQLSSAARVAASALALDRAALRARAGKLASAPAVQRAVVARDVDALERIATGRVQLRVGSERFGALPGAPRLAATAAIERDGHVLARVSVASGLQAALAHARKATPIPRGGGLLLVQNGRVVAGASAGSHAVVREGRLRLGSTRFVAAAAPVPGEPLRVVAIEPLRTVTARSAAYGLRTLLAAILTLLVASALVIRFARPVARTFDELSNQAEHDPLTGLANRRALDSRIDEELERARRHGTHLALVLVDVDDFKQFNDRYGHQCGDEVLGTFAAVLAGSLRELDLAGRFGGEEFALVLPGTPVEGACVVAEQIRRTLAEVDLSGPGDKALRITASFGAAAFPSCATADDLIAAADRALYEAKHLGKNRVVGAGAARDAVSVRSTRT